MRRFFLVESLLLREKFARLAFPVEAEQAPLNYDRIVGLYEATIIVEVALVALILAALRSLYLAWWL